MSKLTNEMDKRNRLLALSTELVTRGIKTAEDRAEHARLTKELDDADDLITLLRRVDGFVLLLLLQLSLPCHHHAEGFSRTPRKAS